MVLCTKGGKRKQLKQFETISNVTYNRPL